MLTSIEVGLVTGTTSSSRYLHVHVAVKVDDPTIDTMRQKLVEALDQVFHLVVDTENMEQLYTIFELSSTTIVRTDHMVRRNWYVRLRHVPTWTLVHAISKDSKTPLMRKVRKIEGKRSKRERRGMKEEEEGREAERQRQRQRQREREREKGWRRKDRVRKWREKAWRERNFTSLLSASYIHVHTCIHLLH